MAEYINRDDLLNVINSNVAEKHNERCSQLLEAILNAPLADVVEVKHGKWKLGKSGCIYLCSCGYAAHPREAEEWVFCPCCGAKMDGERNDT